MKTILSTLFLLLSALMPTTLWAQELAGDEAIEPYAVLNEDSTMLTFYYDEKKEERIGMSVGPFTSDTGRGWHSARKTITQVVFDDSFADYTGLTSTNLWFCNLSALTTITGVSNVNTENVTTFRTMFSGCSSLTALDLTGWNTSSVANMAFMFEGCSGLTSLVVPFNTSNVTAMDNMFLGCSGLTALDLSTFNTANVKSTSYMFSSCTNLKTVYVGSEWSMDAVTQSGQMFNNCPSLVGGKGTSFSTSHMTAEYAHIDGGTDNPGYLTDVNAPAAAQDGDFFTALNADGVLMSFRVLSAADKTCEIYKGYEIAAIDTETSGAMNIPETVKDSLDRQYTVTRIGHYAFLHCKNITEVTTPSTVTSIGNNAFHDCASLTNYDIPAGVTELCDRTFYETNFKHIVIPANITNIMHESFGSSSAITVTSYIQQPFALGENAFGYSTQTATLYVPVGTIDAYKATDGWKDFYRIVENSNIQFADNIVKEICVTNWDKNGDGELSTSEAGAVTSISDVFKKQSISSFDELQYFTGLNKIDNEAFSGCTQLSSVRLPLTITEIGYAAFVDCPITSVEIPSSVTNIGNQAFLGTSLETLSIPSSVTTVGLSAFNATNLKSVNIPATLTSIGQSAFLNYGLESLVVEEGNPVYDSRNNCNALIETSSNTLLTGCNNTVIPETVTSIGEAAFRWMNNLTSITIPASVEHIGNYAFDVSSYLTSIVCEREYAVEAESNIFNDYSYQEATLYVPAAGIQSYNMTSPWNLFQHKETLGGSTEPETYAVLSGDNTTLTFYYDTKKSERNGMDIGPFVNAEERPWHQMRESIENVIFDSAVTNDTTITSTANWLAGFSSLKNIDGLQWLNTKNVTSMESMFSLCSAINWLNLSNFNTSKVTNMEQMFLNCETMETVDLSSFNTSHVTSFNRMFTSCLKLKSLDLSNFNTSEVKGMVSMFSDCSDLSAIYVGNNWDASKVEDSSDMFVGCTNLVGGAGTTYDINHTDATYAHIDGGSNNPGYLTDKDAKVWSVIGTINGNWDTDTEMTSQDGDNIVATVEEDLSGVIVMFNADTKEITYSIMSPVYSVTGSKIDEDGKTISGWLNWADDADMTKDENGIYSVTFDNMEVGNYEFKVRLNHEWTYNWGSSGDLGGANMLLTIAQAGPVTIYFDPETHLASTAYPQKMEQVATPTFSWNEDKLTISSETEGATITYKFEDGYYLVGGNGEWSSSKVQKMSQSSEEYIYTYVLQGFDTNLWFAFGDVAALNAIADDDWSQLFGATVDGSDLSGKYDRRYNLGADKSFNVDGSAPYYRFTINTQDKTYLIEPLDSDPGFIASSDVVYTYTDPVEIKSDVFISAVAKKEGMKDSETTTLDYPYTAWRDLRDAEDKGQSVIAEYAGNDKVPEKLLDELKYLMDEAHQMYVERTAERASIEDMTAKIQSMIQDVIAMAAAEAEPYAVLSEENTVLTFYYDEKKAERNGMSVGPFAQDQSEARGWNDNSETIVSAIIDDSFANYTELTSTAYWFYECRNLTTIAGIEYLKTDSVTNMSNMFYNCSSLTTLDVTGFNTQNVTNMYQMFCYCSGLTSIDLSSFNTENVTNMDGMFTGCSSLTNLDVSGFKTQNVTTMKYMFQACSGLSTLDVSHFNTAKVTETHGMFRLCSGLEILDLSSFNTEKVEEIRYMFEGCSGLKTIYVGESWSTANVKYGDDMFVGCGNLVGGAGTVYDADHVDVTYAHIDGGVSNPGYFTDKNAPVISDDIIQFADANVKAICVKNWDTNGDGELSKDEAAAVSSIGTVFKENKTIGSFNELKYFTGLQSLSIGAFEESSVTSLELPDGLKEIGSDAFSQCRQLKSIFIPATVSKMGSDRGMAEFWLCYNLETIIVDENNKFYTAVDNVLFNREMTKIIRYPAAKPDVAYEIPNTVTTINQNCFEACSNLMAVNIPASVNEMGYGVFQQCDNLITVTISDGVTVIGEDAFRSCKRLAHIHIPASVRQIGREDRSPENAFFWSDALMEITVDENNPYFMSDGGILYSKDKSIIAAYPPALTASEFTVPYGVTKISSCCFTGTENLKSIHFPETVVAYDNAAINISNSTLQSLTVMATAPVAIEKNAFSTAVYSATLYVPSGTVEAYKNATGWKEFQNIVEMDATIDYTFDSNGVLTVRGETTMADALSAAGGTEEVAKTITAVVWAKGTPLTNSDLQGLDNPNMLIFVPADSLAPQNRDNVVIGDLAKNIVLKDVTEGNGSFYSPKSFKAEMISYTHEYRQQTEIGVARGWETIALPFTVQTIMHEKQGRIVPFGISDSGANFWLRQMTSNGLQRATQIEANVPYIISMPNNEAYYAQNNLAGRVTFSSQDAMVPMTEYTAVHMQVEGGMLMFVPCFQGATAGNMIYALNVGEARGNHPEGSVFEANYRDIRPFEAYTVHEGNYDPAPQYIPVFDLNEAGFTGIEEVRSQMSDGRSDVWYDLNGRRLQSEPTQKGVYLHNGRKQVVK